MGFLDNITKKLNEVSQEVISQGSSIAGTAKNKMGMAGVDKQLTVVYAELGKKYFESTRNNPPAEYAELFQKIKDLLVQVEFYKAETRRERGLVVCPKCGAEVQMGVAFCSNCGNTMPPVDMTQQQSGYQPYMIVQCPQCGVELPNGTAFCTSCGANLQNVQPKAPSMPLGAVNLGTNNGSFSTPTPSVSIPQMQSTPMPPMQSAPMPPMPPAPPVPMPTPIPNVNSVPMPSPIPNANPVPMPTPTANPGVTLNKAPTGGVTLDKK